MTGTFQSDTGGTSIPLLSEEMSGSAKGVTAAKVRGRKYIRNRGYSGGVRTSAQAAVKSIFKQLSQSWKNLTNAQVQA